MSARETSIETYEQIRREGLVRKNQFEVYDVLFHHGPMTAREVTEFLVRKNGGLCDPYSFQPRLSELEKLGCVVCVGTRQDRVTGRRAQICDVTKNRPVSQPKKARLSRDQIARLIPECIAIYNEGGRSYDFFDLTRWLQDQA